MATSAHFLMQDKNLNILHNGGKTDVTKADKKGRISGRKALNDISNSRKPSFQSKKTDNLINAVTTGKYLCAASIATTKKRGKATEKGKEGGRKALGEITNSVKRPLQYVPKTGGIGKLSAVAEEKVPISVVDERFLHNHQECIKAQTKIMDLDFFMKSVGLDNDFPVKPSAVVKSSPNKVGSFTFCEQPSDDQVLKFLNTVISGNFSPACRSPESPKLPYMNWGEENISDLMVIETPELMHP